MDTEPQLNPKPDTTLKVGDVVTLHSGGPKMTITNLSEGDGPEGYFDLICWVDGRKKPTIIQNISPDCLAKALY